MRVSIALLAGSAGAFSTSRNTLAAPRRQASSSQLQMLDAAVIQGGAAAVGGLAVGLGMAWFSEQQVEQGEQRGSDAVSEATRAKMYFVRRLRCILSVGRGRGDGVAATALGTATPSM